MPDNNPNPNPNGLDQIVNPSWTNEAGDSYSVTTLDVVGSNIRQQVKAIVKALKPEAYAEYKKIKNEGREPGKPPKLTAARAASKDIMGVFVDLTQNIPGL